MITSVTKIEPRYVETDQMGIVHHSNYLIYYEMGRIRWLEELGFSYDRMERDGFMLPVYKVAMQFSRPLRFGNKYRLETTLKNLPSNRIVFNYTLSTEEGSNCASCELTLVFTRTSDMRPCRPPQDFMDACRGHF